MATANLVAARATDLQTIRTMLEEQRVRRYDVVASSTALSAKGGKLLVATGEVALDESGVTQVQGTYDVGDLFNEGLADKLSLPTAHLKKWSAERTDIWDSVVNLSLHGGERDGGAPYPADDRKHLVRLLRGDDGEPGYARALLSDRYRPIESLDALIAVLQGAQEAGITVMPEVCDLTERRCVVNLAAPQIGALAPTLLNGYRNHFGGAEPHLRAGGAGNALQWEARNSGWTLPAALAAAEREGQSIGGDGAALPVLTAGLRFTNSETGNGSRTLVPYMRAQVCGNRLILDLEADRRVHLGSELNEGEIIWSQETIDRELALIKSQTVDAVRNFLSQDFLDEQVAKVEELAGAKLPRKAEPVVKEIAAKLKFTKAEAQDIFDFFTEGGQPTAGGVANAITALAQTLPDADRAADMERKAYKAMELAAA